MTISLYDKLRASIRSFFQLTIAAGRFRIALALTDRGFLIGISSGDKRWFAGIGRV